MKVLSPAEWQARAAAHEKRVDVWVQPYLRRRRADLKHPVEDFLFTYYSYRPGRLRSWHPGAGVVLAGADPLGPDYRRVRLETEIEIETGAHPGAHPETHPGAGAGAGADGTGIALDIDGLLPRRKAALGAIRALLAATVDRPGFFGCFGVHEWAMVHRLPAGEIRHADQPLRLSPAEIAGHVEQREVRCGHYDAFRFFTPAARPLNTLQPDRDSMLMLEQPGCLHTNMDLYKWAYKLSPLIRSELVADCFELALEIRVLDMRASPYDLSELGLAPIKVELPEGRAEYAAAQRGFADRAMQLRRRLLAECDALLGREAAQAAAPGGATLAPGA